LTYAGFDALQALDTEPCRPFDRDRRGLSLGEGAAALVLETDAHARARGARPRAAVLGWAATSDAHHVTAPHPDGASALAARDGRPAASRARGGRPRPRAGGGRRRAARRRGERFPWLRRAQREPRLRAGGAVSVPVAVTGLGVLSAFGHGVDRFWAALVSGE